MDLPTDQEHTNENRVGLPTDQVQIIMSDCLLLVEQVFSVIMVIDQVSFNEMIMIFTLY